MGMNWGSLAGVLTIESVQLRAFLERWSLVLLVLCAGLALTGGYLAYDAHMTTEEIQEEEIVGTWTVDSSFEHSATVSQGAPVFNRGERLQNRKLYFMEVSPTLQGVYTVGHRNSEGEDASASVEITRVIRSVENTQAGDVVHWSDREQMKRSLGLQLDSGEEANVTVEIDISALNEQILSIEEELEAAPGEPEILLIAETEMESTVNGKLVTDQRTERLVITPETAAYRVKRDEQGLGRYEVNTTVTRTAQPSPLAAYGSILLVLVGAVGAVAIWFGERSGAFAVTELERERYRLEATRYEFDEWISAAHLPENAPEERYEVDSLEDLVNIAIDSNRRVLEDGSQYWVRVDDVVYCYEAPLRVDDDPLRLDDDTLAGGTETVSQEKRQREPEDAPDGEEGGDPTPSVD